MLEAKAFVALITLPTGFVNSHYEAVLQMIAHEEVGISSFHKAVHYLLRNYDQCAHIDSPIITSLQ